MSHWRALMTPQKAAPWTGCIHFCDSYPIMSSMSFTSVSIFSVWCCSRYLSLWTKRPRQKSVIKESKYLKMTFKLFNFSLSIFVSLSLFSLSWSVSLEAKISEKNLFFRFKAKKNRPIFAYFRLKRKWAAHPIQLSSFVLQTLYRTGYCPALGWHLAKKPAT